MNQFIKSMKDKRFRCGTFSTAMMLFAAALFLLANLLAGEFNVSRDLTEEKIYSLSRRSLDFLAELDRNVNIYPLVRTGNERQTYLMAIMTQLLTEYEDASGYIRVEYRDPMINPAFVHQYAAAAGIEGGIGENSIIVESGKGVRVISPHNMIAWDINVQTGEELLRSINIETEITRAIHSVTTGEPSVVYHVTGSGELAADPQFINFLESENFIMREANLTLHDIPEDADILFITIPARDWTELKAERILDFLINEGRAFFALDYTAETFTYMNAVLAAYGLKLGDYVVLEGDPRRVFMGTPLYVIPGNENHRILENITERNLANLLVIATGIEELEIRRASVDIAPIWTTSREAYGRIDPVADTMSQIPGDTQGPFNLAVAVTDQFFADRTYITRLVVVGNSAFLDDDLNRRYAGGGNWQFVLSSLRWLQGQPAGIFIPPRVPPGTNPLMINDFQANAVGAVTLALPVITLGIGILVWYRRRYS